MLLLLVQPELKSVHFGASDHIPAHDFTRQSRVTTSTTSEIGWMRTVMSGLTGGGGGTELEQQMFRLYTSLLRRSSSPFLPLFGCHLGHFQKSETVKGGGGAAPTHTVFKFWPGYRSPRSLLLADKALLEMRDWSCPKSKSTIIRDVPEKGTIASIKL